ncbi:MAG: SBBP repeat-containing protein [Pseudomonadota bacterium]
MKYLILLILFMTSCIDFSSFERSNPFDEENEETHGVAVDITVTQGQDYIKIEWDSLESYDVDGYLVYRGSNSDSYLKIKNSFDVSLSYLEILEATVTSYTDYDLTDGISYYYYVMPWLGEDVEENLSISRSDCYSIHARIDTDGDGYLDRDDDDSDNDGLIDEEDNCPYDSNEDQADYDEDGVGDLCDNCYAHSNSDQLDTNDDGVGDECTVTPDTTLLASPALITNSTTAEFEFSCDAFECSFRCGIDGESVTSCVSPLELDDLEDGEHTFGIYAVDYYGNFEEEGVGYTWVVDTTEPYTFITTNPDLYDSVNNFELSSDEDIYDGADLTYEYKIDDGPYQECSSTLNLTGITEGSHTIYVRSYDAAGNYDESPATYTWTYDATNPTTIIDSYPNNPDNTATFTFEADEEVTYECKIDSEAYEACTSPKTYSSLSQASHTFYVRGTDLAGNVEETPQSYTWVYDTVYPSLTVISTPDNPGSGSTFEFSSDDIAGNFYCKLDAEAYSACSSPKTYSSLTQGSHTVYMKVIDQAGNQDISSYSYTWVYDTIDPTTSIESTPENPGNTSTFSFDSDDESTTFYCKIDSESYSECTSPKIYTGLSETSHTFYVKSIDQAGNEDDTPASYSWTYDVTNPTSTILTNPEEYTNETSYTFSFSADETVTFECKIDTGSYETCTSPKTYSSLSESSHTFYLKANDLADNEESSPQAYTWTYDNTDPSTTITGYPDDPSSSSSATFNFSADETSTYECKIDSGDYETCTSPKEYSNLTEHNHTFYVRATDLAGNLESTEASYSWDMDWYQYGWSYNLGGINGDYGRSIFVDSNDNLCFGGSFSGTANLNDLDNPTYYTAEGSRDAFIRKIASNEVQRGFLDIIEGDGYASVYGIAEDSNGNIYIAGIWTGVADFGGPYEFTGDGGIFVAKYTPEGGLHWAKVNEASFRTIGNPIAVDSNDNIYLTGYFVDTVDFDFSDEIDEYTADAYGDIFVTKINSDGGYVWTKAFGGSGYDRAHSIAIDSNDNIFIIGEYDSDPIDFDFDGGGDEHGNQGIWDVFLTKINSDGAYAWTKVFGGDNDDLGHSIVIDSNDNIWLAGKFMSTSVDFDYTEADDTIYPSGGNYDTFVMKINSNYTYNQTITFGNTDYGVQGFNITKDSLDNIFITGEFKYTVDFDFTDGVDEHTASTKQIYITKINNDMTYAWTKVFGATMEGMETFVNSSGDIYTVNYFRNTADFDYSDGTDNLTSEGDDDFSITKIERIED